MTCLSEAARVWLSYVCNPQWPAGLPTLPLSQAAPAQLQLPWDELLLLLLLWLTGLVLAQDDLVGFTLLLW